MLAIFRIRLCPQVFVFILLLPNDFLLSLHNDVAYHTALDFVVLKKRIILSWILQHQRSTVYNVSYCIGFYSINPFSATACKISGLKSAHIHPCRQYIWWSYNKPIFNAVHFDRNRFTVSKGEEKKTELFQIWHFYWSLFEWRRRKHGSERVKGAKSTTFVGVEPPLCITDGLIRLITASHL